MITEQYNIAPIFEKHVFEMTDFLELIDDVFRALNPHVSSLGQPTHNIQVFRGDKAVSVTNAGAINKYSNLLVECIHPQCTQICRVSPFCAPHAYMYLRVRIGEETPFGEGLFAVGKAREVVFKKGDYIAPYTGICITKQDIDRLYSTKNNFCPYTITFEDTTIDSMLAMSYAAKANTHTENIRINSEFVYDGHPFLQATKRIYANTEIFTLYVRNNAMTKDAYFNKIVRHLDSAYQFQEEDGSDLPDIRDFFKL